MTAYRKGESPWTDKTIEKVVALWNRGLNKREIGDQVGVSKEAVTGLIWRLRKRGVDIPVRRYAVHE